MKAYIAGKLSEEKERKFLEKVSKIVEEKGFETFLPHRDVGILDKIDNVKKIFNEDIKKGFKDCDIIIAVLDGFHIGAGTAWELGYAYAKKIPSIGIKTDESIEGALESLSAILISSTKIVNSLEELEKELIKFKKIH